MGSVNCPHAACTLPINITWCYASSRHEILLRTIWLLEGYLSRDYSRYDTLSGNLEVTTSYRVLLARLAGNFLRINVDLSARFQPHRLLAAVRAGQMASNNGPLSNPSMQIWERKFVRFVLSIEPCRYRAGLLSNRIHHLDATCMRLSHSLRYTRHNRLNTWA